MERNTQSKKQNGSTDVQPTEVTVVATVKENETPGVCECTNCGCEVAESEVEQNPTKECSECGGTEWSKK